MSSIHAEIKINRLSPLWRQMFCVHQSFLKHLAQSSLRKVLDDTSVSEEVSFQIQVRLTTDHEVSSLNKEYRRREGSTNVLSFHQFDSLDQIKKELSRPYQTGINLGDLVFSDRTIFNEAFSFDRSIVDHFSHLFVHGLFHLLGYDHGNPSEADIMERLEIEVLEKNGIPNPYQIT